MTDQATGWDVDYGAPLVREDPLPRATPPLPGAPPAPVEAWRSGDPWASMPPVAPGAWRAGVDAPRAPASPIPTPSLAPAALVPGAASTADTGPAFGLDAAAIGRVVGRPRGGGGVGGGGKLARERDELAAGRKSNVTSRMAALDKQAEDLQRLDVDRDIAAEGVAMAYEEQQAEIKRQAALDQAVAEESRRETEAASQRLSAFRETAKVDPRRIFKDRGTLATIGAGLGVALGEFGRALTGGDRNVALEIVNSAIDRDIQAQVDAFERKERGLEGAYAAAQGTAKSKAEARAMARVAAYDAVSSQLNQFAEMKKGTDEAERALLLRGQIEQQRGALEAEYLQGETTMNESRIRQQQAAAAAAARVAAEQAKERMLAEAKYTAIKEEEDVSGIHFSANTTNEMKQAALKEIIPAKRAMAVIDDLIAKSKDTKFLDKLSPTQRKAWTQNMNVTLPVVVNAAFGQGAATGDDIVRIASGFEDPTGTGLADATALLQNMRDRFDPVYQSTLETYGARSTRGKASKTELGATPFAGLDE